MYALYRTLSREQSKDVPLRSDLYDATAFGLALDSDLTLTRDSSKHISGTPTAASAPRPTPSISHVYIHTRQNTSLYHSRASSAPPLAEGGGDGGETGAGDGEGELGETWGREVGGGEIGETSEWRE